MRTPVIFEDEHLLVVNKPAGWNTHAPSPYAGEGLYDWLHHREPRWAKLAIIHRLDKETSGLIVFAKSTVANRSLTDQFTRHAVHKRYRFLTDRPVRSPSLRIKSALVRAGEKYLSRPLHAGGVTAETQFKTVGTVSLREVAALCLVEAEPLTGRTHQIRVHAAASGFPIFGDTLYGGTPAERVFLHASEITFKHPATGEAVTFAAPPDFEADPRAVLRRAVVDPELTDAYRIVHGAGDGRPGWYVDRLGDYLLSHAEVPLTAAQREELAGLMRSCSVKGAWHKTLNRRVRQTKLPEASPQLALGEAGPDRFTVRENGLRYELSFQEGYSVGLFLDQRDNRRRLLTGHVGAGLSLGSYEVEPSAAAATRESSEQPPQPLAGLEVLNAFAYTCGFSVAAARAGARTTSLDLSRKYLDWGRRNFALNELDPGEHDFIYGDVFDWLRRWTRKQRAFDLVLLDPPTFSQSKESGVFRAEQDYRRLVAAGLPVVKPGGVLFVSTNAASWAPADFVEVVTQAARAARRSIAKLHYAPQPPDFPVTRAEPAYLKTAWLKLD